MITLEKVNMLEEGRDQRAEVASQLAVAENFPSEARQYPPGVDNKGLEFNAQAVFSPHERVESGGCPFNSGEGKAESGLVVREEPPRSLVDEVVPGLPRPEPLRRQGVARVLTNEVKENFFLLLSVGLSRRQAAARLDIDHTTISHAVGRDQEFAALVQRAEEMAASEPMLCLIAASRKNWRAALTLINFKRQFPQQPDREEKQRRMKEKLEDTRMEMEYQQQVAYLREQASEQEKQRQQAIRDAKEEAWQQRERAMLQKEREEREAKRKRRAERESGQSSVASVQKE
jgi:hypothetical protein